MHSWEFSILTSSYLTPNHLVAFRVVRLFGRPVAEAVGDLTLGGHPHEGPFQGRVGSPEPYGVELRLQEVVCFMKYFILMQHLLTETNSKSLVIAENFPSFLLIGSWNI